MTEHERVVEALLQGFDLTAADLFHVAICDECRALEGRLINLERYIREFAYIPPPRPGLLDEVREATREVAE